MPYLSYEYCSRFTRCREFVTEALKKPDEFYQVDSALKSSDSSDDSNSGNETWQSRLHANPQGSTRTNIGTAAKKREIRGLGAHIVGSKNENKESTSNQIKSNEQSQETQPTVNSNRYHREDIDGAACAIPGYWNFKHKKIPLPLHPRR